MLIGASAATIGQVASARARAASARRSGARCSSATRRRPAGRASARRGARQRPLARRPPVARAARARPGRDAHHFALAARLGMRASLFVPLRARGRRSGVDGRRLRGAARPAPRPTCSRSSRTSRRAPRWRSTTPGSTRSAPHVARTLQRSLLPPDLPEVPGLELAAELPGRRRGRRRRRRLLRLLRDRRRATGRWSSATSAARAPRRRPSPRWPATRCAPRRCTAGGRPTCWPSSTRRSCARGCEYRFCTALYVALTPGEGGVRVTVASGGHPLPLLVRADGRVETVGRPGTLLGIVPEPRIEDDRGRARAPTTRSCSTPTG